MIEKREYQLDQLYDFASGLSKPRSEFGAGYPFVSFKDVFDNYFVPDKPTSLVRSTDRERERCSIQRGDVFLTRTSETLDELGMSSVALTDIPEATFNGFTKRLRPKNPDVIVPEYAAYYFRSPFFRRAIMAMTTMSTRASLNNEMLGRLVMHLPSTHEQEAIGSTLFSLDKKINLNRRMNETLEAMAQAIFSDWFADFSPTRRKQEGATDPVTIMGGVTKDAERAARLADLFPDVFGDNGLPVGWKHRALSEFAEIQNGFAFKSKDWGEFGVPVVKIGSIKPGIVDLNRVGFVSESIANEKSRFEIPVGAALVGLTGYVGEVGRVPPTDVLPLLNQRVGRFMPRGDSDFSPFVYCASRMPEFKDYAISQAHGSAQPNVSTRSLLQYEVASGDESLVHAYDELLEPLFDLQITKHGENKTLVESRDLLLPHLMSGEITLRDAETVAR